MGMESILSTAAVAQSLRAFAPQAYPSRNRPKSFKHVVAALLPNAWQWVWVSRVLGDDYYKQMTPVTVGLAY